MGTDRYYHQAASVDGYCYMIGGASSDSTMERYDRIANSWTPKANVPGSGYAYFGATSLGGFIYVCQSSVGGSCNKYEHATNTWTSIASLPSGRGGGHHQMAAVDPYVYVVGGKDSHSNKGLTRYNPATNQWEARASMSDGHENYAIATLGQHIYVMGGCCNKNNVERYDTATNTWENLASMPSGGFMARGASDGTYVYKMGGQDSTNKLERYDPATNSWASMANMANSREVGAVCAL